MPRTSMRMRGQTTVAICPCVFVVLAARCSIYIHRTSRDKVAEQNTSLTTEHPADRARHSPHTQRRAAAHRGYTYSPDDRTEPNGNAAPRRAVRSLVTRLQRGPPGGQRQRHRHRPPHTTHATRRARARGVACAALRVRVRQSARHDMCLHVLVHRFDSLARSQNRNQIQSSSTVT